MRTLKYIFIIVVVLGFLGYVCYDIFFPNGFGGEDESQQAEAIKKTELNIGAPNNISSLPIWIAQEDSIFDSLRVDITVKDFTDPLDCDVAFAEGKTNLSITDPKRAEWLKATKKKDFVEEHSLPMPYALVACHNARISSLQQLKDKLVAHTRHSAFSDSFNHCLDSIHLSRDSVYMVQINNPSVAMLMLHNAELDATFLTEPYISLAKAMGHNILFKNNGQALLIASPSLSESLQLKAFNKAYEEALKRIRKNGITHYKDLIARRCKCSPQFEKDLKVKF